MHLHEFYPPGIGSWVELGGVYCRISFQPVTLLLHHVLSKHLKGGIKHLCPCVPVANTQMPSFMKCTLYFLQSFYLSWKAKPLGCSLMHFTPRLLGPLCRTVVLLPISFQVSFQVFPAVSCIGKPGAHIFVFF